MRRTKRLNFLMCCCLSVTLFLVAGCDQQEKKKSARKDRPHLVETVTVERADIELSQTRTGTLKARHEVEIYNQEEGRITELPFYEGDQVNKGDLVVVLDGDLLRAQLDRATAQRRQAEQDLKRLRELFNKKLAAEETLGRGETEVAVAKAEEAVLRTRYGYTRIESPISGLVSERNSEPGNIAERYTHLLTISDHSSLITQVSVSELLMSGLAVGQPARVRIDALGEIDFPGKINRIHPNLDPVSRQGIVEIELQPVPEGARPGQLCRIRFDLSIGKRLAIPLRALRRDNAGEYVYVVDEENIVRRTTVASGRRVSEQVIITEGLEPGQQIVVRGFLDLRDGKSVKRVDGAPGK